jgi:rhodanese-related sulfurtransferase
MSNAHSFSEKQRTIRRVLMETLLVLALGGLAALVMNFLSPRGLSLTRDYFPANHGLAPSAAGVAAGGTASRADPDAGSVIAPVPAATPKRAEVGLITTTAALKLFRDPEYEQELIIFVDARNNRHYEEGHIPGAYQLDRYYPEKHLPVVLPAVLNANRVVVYCTGGACEDSHFAAQMLQEAGVPLERLSVFAGGITDWEGQRLPIETGARNSGNLRETKP